MPPLSRVCGQALVTTRTELATLRTSLQSQAEAAGEAASVASHMRLEVRAAKGRGVEAREAAERSNAEAAKLRRELEGANATRRGLQEDLKNANIAHAEQVKTWTGWE